MTELVVGDDVPAIECSVVIQFPDESISEPYPATRFRGHEHTLSKLGKQLPFTPGLLPLHRSEHLERDEHISIIHDRGTLRTVRRSVSALDRKSTRLNSSH